MTLDDRAEELASDLSVDYEEVRSDLETLRSYDVPMDEAVQSLRRKYGDGTTGSSQPSTVEVADVTTELSSATVTARVLTVGARSIRFDGEERVIREGQLADGTGKIDYTAWEDFGFSPGDTVTVGNANVREWEGAPELNLGEHTSVRFEEEPIDVPYEIGGNRSLVDLEPGDRGVTLEVVVEEVETRTIDGRDGETDILSGVIADESGRLPFTDWEPRETIEEGESIRIENAYVREFRGVPSVNVSEFSTVESLGRTVDSGEAVQRLGIGEALAAGGLYDVELVGNVVAIRDGSGLIQRCPECDRVVQSGQCRSHGDVDGYDDLRTKAVVDDGTGAVTAVLDDDLTAEVYGGGLEDAREQARAAMDQDVVADEIREQLVGSAVRVRGHLSVDDFGANVEAIEFGEREDEPADGARELIAKIDALAGTAEVDG